MKRSALMCDGEIEAKTCSECGITKLQHEFRRRGPHSFTGKCKSCHQNYEKAYRDRNRQKLLAWKKDNYLRNGDEIRAKNRVYYQSHREEKANQRRAYYQKHREAILAAKKERQKHQSEEQKDHRKAYRREYLQANLHLVTASNGRWRAANQELVRAYRRAWIERNPEAMRAARERWKKSNPDRVKEQRQRTHDRIPYHYIAKVLGVSDRSQLTPELVTLKREQLKLHRLAKTLQAEAKKHHDLEPSK